MRGTANRLAAHRVAAIVAYIVYRFPIADVRRAVAGLALRWSGPLAAARSRAGSTGAPSSRCICAYISVRYEALTYELAMLPMEGIVGSAILIFLVLEASRRTSGWGFVAIILAMAVYVYISPHLPGDFQTRWVSPERLVAYLGLDVNGMIGVDPGGGGADRDPVHHPGPGAGAHRRRGFLLRSRDVGDGTLPRRRRQDRGGGLGAVRHDLGQRGVERAGGRHRHHPDHDQVGLLAATRRPRSSRSARPAAS